MNRKLFPAILAAAVVLVVLIIAGIVNQARAIEIEQEEPKAVGVLKIPAVLREYAELESNLKVTCKQVSSKLDNERKLAMRQARQERKNVSRVTAESEDVREETQEPELVYIGRFKITGYDTCSRCCGNSNGITASGTQATVGRTCAVAKGISFGTVLYIDGIGDRVVEDRGGFAANTIDVLCEDHPQCFAITGWYDVYVVEED